MRRSRLVVALLLGLACGGSGAEHAATPTITAQQLALLIAQGSPPVVLDVRTRAEYAKGHIPGALNIPHDELAGRLSEIPGDPSEEIVVHCQVGGRAAVAEELLREHGYTDVRDLVGHWQGWQEANLPRE